MTAYHLSKVQWIAATKLKRENESILFMIYDFARHYRRTKIFQNLSKKQKSRVMAEN